MSDANIFKFLDVRLAELHFFVVLHAMNSYVCFRFYRRSLTMLEIVVTVKTYTVQ